MLFKKDYFKTVRRPYPPLFGSLIMHGYKNSKSYAGLLPKKYQMKNLIILDGNWHYHKKEFKTAQGMEFPYWQNSKRLRWVQNELQRREGLLTEAAKQNFVQYSAAYEFYTPALLLVWCIEEPVTQKIRLLLGKKLSNDAVEQLMSNLNIPLRDNFYKQEEYDLVTTKDFRAHIRKYEWINSRYGEVRPYTLSEARAKFKQINKKLFLKDWRAQKNKVNKSIVYAKSLIPPKDRVVIDIMQFIVFYRTQRTDIINRSQYLALPMLRELARKKKIPYEELLQCTKEEILNKIPSHTILQERMKFSGTVMDQGKIYCVDRFEYSSIKNQFADNVYGLEELKGNVACSGLVRGRARLIMSSKDFRSFKLGEILIASMTNPHMVTIMKKAAAFVTDEGGITCHAAIMSRELKKPCIIGTKLATKVFKTGDLVEVDANKGIVRRLK